MLTEDRCEVCRRTYGLGGATLLTALYIIVGAGAEHESEKPGEMKAAVVALHAEDPLRIRRARDCRAQGPGG